LLSLGNLLTSRIFSIDLKFHLILQFFSPEAKTVVCRTGNDFSLWSFYAAAFFGKWENENWYTDLGV